MINRIGTNFGLDIHRNAVSEGSQWCGVLAVPLVMLPYENHPERVSQTKTRMLTSGFGVPQPLATFGMSFQDIE